MSTNASAATGWAGEEGGEIAMRGSFFSLTGSLCRQWEPGKRTEVRQVGVEEEGEREGAQELLLQDEVQGFGEEG